MSRPQDLEPAQPTALAGEMTVYTAERVKDEVLSSLRKQPASPLLDLSQVTDLDTAGVQILLLARRLAGAAGGGLRVVAASDAVREVLALCGLRELLAAPTGVLGEAT